MKIEVKTAIPSGAVPVILVKGGKLTETHLFFTQLSKENKQFIKAVLTKAPLRGDTARRIFLPDGEEVMVIGAVERRAFTRRKAILVARRIVAYAKWERISRVAVSLSDFFAGTGEHDEKECLEVMATQCEMANFEFVRYKTVPKEGWSFLESVHFVIPKENKLFVEAARRGKIIGEEVNRARELSNTPGGDMTPGRLAEEALQTGRECGFKVKVLGESEMSELRMGGVLGVAKGSTEKPAFIVLEYFKGKKREKPVVLVGKGVTFDTGGLNLKPESALYEMHMDMSGGASVLHAMAALARLKVKKNIVGLIPAVENMPSGSSYRPGDQLITMSGKSIEIMNTDAEGRVILADALTYAKRYDPRLVVDVATLTGSSMRALGQRASALLTPHRQLEAQFVQIGEAVGDLVWPMPLWEEYEEDIRGTFGDLANTGKTKYGGVITAAVFLRQFVKDDEGKDSYPWVHIDIAPRMTSIEGDALAKGAVGAGMSLLVRLLQKK